MTTRLARLAQAASLYGFLLDERDQEIRRQHREGVGPSEIAGVVGMSRQRVWQIINNKETTS